MAIARKARLGWWAILVPLLIGATARAQDASTVRLIEVTGKVELRKADAKDWATATEGAALERGDSLRCLAQGSALLSWSNGALVRVYPETDLTLKGVVFELDKKLEKTFLTMDKGRIFAKAQVPEHIFCHFEVRMGPLHVLTQGAEFALRYADSEGRASALPILGRLVTEVGTQRIRIEEGSQASWVAGEKFPDNAIVPIPEEAAKSLWKTSRDMGGSLLVEEEGTPGGPLVVRFGGVRNRRGSAPYTVKFSVITKGGSGKLKSIRWNFGDGETAEGRKAEHTFTQGVYTVILRVVDENGEKGSAQLNISVEIDCNC